MSQLFNPTYRTITVANVSGLSNIIPRPADGQLVQTLGYYTPGDGGGNLYTYSATASGIVDWGWVLDGLDGDNTTATLQAAENAAGTGVGRFISTDQDISYAKQFGAIAGGTNAAANSIRLNSAISQPNRHLKINRGTFAVDSSIVISNDNITISGLGKESVLQQTAAETNLIQIQNSTSNITIENIHGIGEGTAIVAFENCNFIYSAGAPGLLVRNVRIIGCSSENFSNSSVQLRGTTDSLVSQNRFGQSVNTSNTSADILTYGDCNNILITNNVCTSDISQNIYSGALGNDENIVVSNNICDTKDANGDVIAAPTRKRHGIVCSYNASNRSEFIVSNNQCLNTNWSGIYVPTGTGILVEGNICRNNGISPDAPNGLGSGIHLNNANKAKIVNNQIIDYKSSSSNLGCIRLDNTDACIVQGNVIRSSIGRGIFYSDTNSLINISDNHIEVESIGINIKASVGTEAEGRVARNTIITNGDTIGIDVDQQTENATLSIYDNFIQNLAGSGVGATDTNMGVRMRVQNYRFINNHIVGFATGLYNTETVSGREDANLIRDNYFEECNIAYVWRATNTFATVLVQNTRRLNTPTFASGNGFFGATYEGTEINGQFIITSTAAPTTGTWNVGDVSYNRTPTASGNLGWVCTTAGTPGTWKTFGSIEA